MGKITDEEKTQLESLKQQTLEVASILGELGYQKIIIDHQLDFQKQRVLKIREEEAVLFEDLRSKYGNVSINIETGEF